MIDDFRRLLFTLIAVLAPYCMTAQNVQQYYVIDIDNNSIYLDMTSPMAKVGDVVEVYSEGGYMVHPVTKKRIKKNDTFIGQLEIKQVHSEYTIAEPKNGNQSSLFAVGMKVVLPKGEQMVIQRSDNPIDNADDRIAVLVTPAEVNDIVNVGHFGGYVADMLMEHLLMNDKIRLLDRSVLNAQLTEMELTGVAIDKSTAIEQGKIVGARYVIQCTMQKPDVVNVRTGIPLASFMGAIGAATGANVGAQYASNMQTGTLKAAINISTRVIDLQTGEVMFMTNATGLAQGKSQLALESGALGGLIINGGAQGFKQTMTGQAIDKAFAKIGNDLDLFFDGKIEGRVMNNDEQLPEQKMFAKGSKLFLGTQQLDNYGIQSAFAEHSDLYFQYRKGIKQKKWGMISLCVGGGLFAIGAGIGISGEDDGPAACCIGGLVLMLPSIPLFIIGNKNIKNAANQYNSRNSLANRSSDVELSLALVQNGVGLRLTF